MVHLEAADALDDLLPQSDTPLRRLFTTTGRRFSAKNRRVTSADFFIASADQPMSLRENRRVAWAQWKTNGRVFWRHPCGNSWMHWWKPCSLWRRQDIRMNANWVWRPPLAPLAGREGRGEAAVIGYMSSCLQRRNNIDDAELEMFRTLAKSYAALAEKQIKQMLQNKRLMEIGHGNKTEI